MLSLFKPRAAPNVPDRERLRAALAAKVAAQQAVIESHETLQRLQAVVDQADTLARAAASATRAANDARQRWVRDGCLSNAREHQVLAAAATEAVRMAQSAAVDADDVRKTLARAEDEVRSRQIEVEGAEDAITAAIGVIIAEEAAPLLQRFESIAEEYRTVRAKIMGVSQVLAQKWTLSNKDQMNPAREGEQVIEDALDRAKIKSWDTERQSAKSRDFVEETPGREEAWLDGLMAPWRERAAQLRNDPDV
jgi:hypothetical protein